MPHRSIRLRYNSVYLPEYISTVLLSLIVTALFVGSWPAVDGNLSRMVHLGLAAGLYSILIAMLIRSTWLHRFHFGSVRFSVSESDEPLLSTNGRVIPVRLISSVRESIGAFFGRPARCLHVQTIEGHQFDIYEAVRGFDNVPRLLTGVGAPRAVLSGEVIPEERDRLRQRWIDRQTNFPPPEHAADVLGRSAFRVMCLVPVATVDVAINAALTIFLRRIGQDALTVYAAPIGLAVSAVIARYVYYYLFSSVRLNRRIT
ncbi:hypothetical protein [Stratiformator vulcanicus]|uniref:Uncharacterized protein n=1 Tax=Stratiformator vulcanicus TaxID=2527980 RepID=A0A517R441_9PLAN|nr:hypothetical protein [Stratiformator vulcanicus]QDT38654.1 hypothetical protein Pan189_30490 [Stratiformator vulcanicus]